MKKFPFALQFLSDEPLKIQLLPNLYKNYDWLLKDLKFYKIAKKITSSIIRIIIGWFVYGIIDHIHNFKIIPESSTNPTAMQGIW